MSRFTTILFDADETVLDFFRTEEQSLKKSFERFDLPYGESTHPIYHEINQSLWHEFSMGRLEKSVLTVKRFELLFDRLGLSQDPVAFKECYEGWIAKGFFTVPGAEEALEKLKRQGFRLYCTTNGLKRTQGARLRGAGLYRYFEKVFISEECGSQKPQRAYFDYVFANIDEKDLSKVVLIGDSLTNDIGGGNLAGISTIWFNPNGEPRPERQEEIPDYEIDDLNQIFDILE